jgi:DNA repair exonuclease SbcCD ATPase subunit/nitrate reductase NapE component
MAAPETSSSNPDYAQEWIAFLRKRNLLLSVIWPILLVLFIGAGFTSIYYFQSTQAAGLNNQMLDEKIQLLQNDKVSLTQQLDNLQEKHSQLMTELDNLKSVRAALAEQQDDSVSQLQITTQMLENMKQQLVLLKNENTELTDQLGLAKAALSEMDANYQAELAKATTLKSSQLSELNKQLESRKTAYQALANRQQEMRDEMDRLSALNTTKDKTIAALNTEKSNLAKQLRQAQQTLKSREAEFQALQSGYNELDSKLKALVSPIGVSSSRPAEKNNPTLSDTSKKPSTITGLEEIKKPAPKPQNSADKTLDYDQIKVLP